MKQESNLNPGSYPETLDIPVEARRQSDLMAGDWCERPARKGRWARMASPDKNANYYAQALIDAGMQFFRPTKCAEGYRWLSDAEWAQKQSFELTRCEFLFDDKWRDGLYGACTYPRHHYRIKLSPTPPEGYELCEKAESTMRRCDAARGGWTPYDPGKPGCVKCQPFFARPIPVEVEAIVLKGQRDCIYVDVTGDFQPGDRVRITKL